MSGSDSSWTYSSYDNPDTGRCGFCKLIIDSDGFCQSGCMGIVKRFSIGRELGTKDVE